MPRLLLTALLLVSGALVPGVLGAAVGWINQSSVPSAANGGSPSGAQSASIVVARPRGELTPAPLPTLRAASPPGNLPPFASDPAAAPTPAPTQVVSSSPHTAAPTPGSTRSPRLLTVASGSGGVHLRKLLSSPSDADPLVSDGEILQLAASGAVRYAGDAWYLVRSLDGAATGWAPVSTLLDVDPPQP